MVECKKYSHVNKNEWDDFINICKSPLFFFKRDFLEYHADRFDDCSLMFYQDDVLTAVLPATKKGNVLTSHAGLTYGGLLVSLKARIETIVEIFEKLEYFVKKQLITTILYKPSPVIFHSYPSQEDLYCIHNNLNGKLIRRDLSNVINLKNRIKLSKGRKALISRARKLQLKVVDSTDWHGFHLLLNSVLEKHSATAVHSPKELDYLATSFPENIKLKVVLIDEEIVSAVLFFRFKGVTHTQYMATNQKGRDSGALDFIIESCIEDSTLNGDEYFSFGISTEQNGTILNNGLAAQKESFGARAICIDSYEITVK